MTRLTILVAIFSVLAGRAAAQYADPAEIRRLQAQNEQLAERINLREKERDTLKSQLAIVDRDRKELEKKLQDLQTRCGISGGHQR